MKLSAFNLASLGLVLASAFAGWPSSAHAQTMNVPVDPFLPAPDQSGFLGFASTRTPGSWGVDTTLWLDYARHTLEASSYGAGNSVPVRQRFDGTAIAQLGILSRGALALRMPFVLVQRGDDVAGAPDLAKVAAGNLAVDGRIRVLGAPVRPDGSVNDGGAMALRGVVHLPVGTSNAYFATRFEVSAIGDVELFGISAGAAFGYRHAFDPDRVGGYSLQNQLTLGLGGRLPLPLLARIWPGKLQESVLLELELATTTDNFFSKATTPVEGLFGYRAIIGDFFTTLGVGAGFKPAIGSPDVRVVGGFGWSPRKHDQDADGVPDGEDQCQHLPEDRDGYQDNDGCADDDNDGDLIVDEDDRCPLEPAEIGRDEDEDGCTDK
jgi:OOP family OmpA-OmpF porin